MNIFKIVDKPNKARSNILLFSTASAFIFLAPIFPDDWIQHINNVLFSMLFFSGIYALDNVKKSVVVIAFFAFISQWITLFTNITVLVIASELINIIFLQIIIIQLIIQVAKSKEVNTQVIFESINGYLLMGIMFAAWVAVLVYFSPHAFNGLDPATMNLQDIFYFTFVTLTTLGYGEITPQIPLAKSISLLIATSGQLYIAILIAMLVGKFAGSQSIEE